MDTENYINPIIQDNRILVHIKMVSKNSGYNVHIINKTVSNPSRNLHLWLGINKAVLNCEDKLMDTTPILKDSRTYVPIRFITESFGVNVQWNSKNREVAHII